MKLITQLSSTKTQICQVNRVEYNNEKLTVYFTKTIQIGEEVLDEILDISNPITLELTNLNIEEALNIIFSEALKARKLQLQAISNNSTIVEKPNYKRFYSELLTTELFAISRLSAGEDLQACISYSDFALALTNSIAGNDNPIALQICLNNMIEVLGDKLNNNILTNLKELIEKNNLPLEIWQLNT